MSELFVYVPNPTPYKWPWSTSRRCGVAALLGLFIQVCALVPGNAGLEWVGCVAACFAMVVYAIDGWNR